MKAKLVDFIRRWFPCFGQEHEWSPRTVSRHRTDGVSSYRVEGRICLLCEKFRGERITDAKIICRCECRCRNCREKS